MNIPRWPLFLGLAGLIPFVWGAVTLVSPPLADWTAGTIGPRFVGPYIGLQYGVVILSFMSGVIWGFATRAEGQAAAALYALSVLPALWAFFMVGSGAVSSAIHLITGFLAVLLIDWLAWRHDLAPKWWMQLRLLLTAIVVVSLGVIVL